ncbi:MAG: putative transcriptional regulator, TetR family [Rhodospirillales bacterium]|jgi:AcrR family transcriptional regulator|nr:putative transcriptional regulator, TetR family [Rhodospirillales bacterium]
MLSSRKSRSGPGVGSRAKGVEPPAPAPVEIGKRAAKKSENLSRIKAAARECFVSQGFEETTMRRIAARAGVGLGTLFRYAENKRDLLLLTVIDDVEAAVLRGKASIDPMASLLVNLVNVLAPVYVFFASQPIMSRLLLGELLFYEDGSLARRFWAGRNAMLEALTDCIHIAVAKDEIEMPQDVERVVWLVYSIYHAEHRYCLGAEQTGLDFALARLSDSLKLFIRGLEHRSKI